MCKLKLIIFLITLYLATSLRIPQNPCPNIFSYYQDRNGNVYGEAVIPYDGKNTLVFSLNASFAALFETKVEIKAQLLNPPTNVNSRESLKYNIQLPFSNIIPKITELNYNGRVFCSGPPEPLTTNGVTNVWYSTYYRFSGPGTGSSGSGCYGNCNVFNNDNTFTGDNIPIKDPSTNDVVRPTQQPTQRPITWQTTKATPRPGSTYDDIRDSSPEISDKQKHCESFSVVQLIAGGSIVGTGQYPWITAVFVYNEELNNYSYKCTASLISENHVITAGRCVQFYRQQLVKTEDILFVLGRSDLKNWARNGAVTRGAQRVDVHPDFKENFNSAHADIAIITFDKPAPISNSIKPVCLWSSNNQDLSQLVSKKGVVIGWGKEKNCRETSGLLHMLQSKYVEIPVISQFDCLKAGPEIRNVTSEKTFCAGDGTENGPCIGDDGAGIVFPIKGIFYLRGIASLRTDSKYTIFCDVAKFMPWVKSKMGSS